MELTFGEKLREARKAKKYTQKGLADLVGAKHNSVSDWENNKNKPDPDTIELICGVLDISANYLLSSSENEFSPLEKLIIKKYRDLDDHGREMVDFTLQKEWERSTELKEHKKDNIVSIAPHLTACAANERTDIDVTTEQIENDNNAMENPEGWES